MKAFHLQLALKFMLSYLNSLLPDKADTLDKLPHHKAPELHLARPPQLARIPRFQLLEITLKVAFPHILPFLASLLPHRLRKDLLPAQNTPHKILGLGLADSQNPHKNHSAFADSDLAGSAFVTACQTGLHNLQTAKAPVVLQEIG